MPRKVKGRLPSGSIRIQKQVGKTPEGKRIMKSFTGATRAEAEYKYSQWIINRPDEENPSALTVQEAVRRYIDAKAEVLSPSTINGYESLLAARITPSAISKADISKVSTKDIQLWISDMTAQELSPKTVRNAYALLKASIQLFEPAAELSATLPAQKKPELYCPSDEDIKKLLSVVKNRDLEIAILLAAFGTLRRSEICALESTDIVGNSIRINKALVVNQNNEMVIKTPKTYGSYRTVEMPEFVIEKLKGIEGKIIKGTIHSITNSFVRAQKKSGCPHFRFHDLRHYSASIMHAIGIPDQYIMQRGGWSSDNVMKRVYRNTIDTETQKQTDKINSYFQKISVSHV
ncbi:integrase [Moryella indoligenes]|uniref:Integrase n=1 Tax=Moryella indoligenes TaxID=371674 RepID=A0AAE3VAF3_9FIRM|nr:site-specific integrase [Moryella indoligenes]MDQ0152732.1 integrase [Moryella indoligenes]